LADLRLTKIDESLRALHYHLTEDDSCYFLYDYTSRQGFSYSATNQLISNIKKSPLTKGTPQWRYKMRDIRRCSADLARALPEGVVEQLTFVPIPPSKAREHAEYDDRMRQVCDGIAAGADVRELVYQMASTRASHENDERVTVEELLEVYAIDEALCDPAPSAIAIIDDVITAGTHFRAMADTLRAKFPEAQIIGLFIARRVYPDDEDGPV
jgi:hypothetical protein|tara:strand:- start:59561 stop:60196 length:636 start_codon:yes stop_codon:yes gene_type:complete